MIGKRKQRYCATCGKYHWEDDVPGGHGLADPRIDAALDYYYHHGRFPAWFQGELDTLALGQRLEALMREEP